MPAASLAGTVNVIDVGETTFMLAALLAPMRTAVAPSRFAPVTVMTSPPTMEALAALRLVTTGGGGWYRKRACEFSGLTPLALLTVTSTAPLACGGVVATRVVTPFVSTLRN